MFNVLRHVMRRAKGFREKIILISLLFLGQSLDLGSVVFTLFDLLSKLFTILIPLILILILFRSFMMLVKTK